MLPARAFKYYSFLIACGLLLSGILNAQNLPDSIVTYYFSSDRDSAHTHKIAYEFNSAGQKISYSIYTWDTNRRHWDGWQFYCEECSSSIGRYEYGYDEKGNQVFTNTFAWWGDKLGWVERSTGKKEDFYDDRGNLVTTIFSGWNDTEKTWDPGFAYEYEYDEAGNLISKTIYDRGLPLKDWLPLEKTLYSFDGSGRKTQEIRQVWNSVTRDWINQVKTEWEYPSTGTTTEYATFRWSLAGLVYEWKEDQRHRIINEFDQAGYLVLTTESLKISATRWTPTWKELRAYNSSGQQVLLVISEGMGSLTEKSRTVWEYHADGRLATEAFSGAVPRWPGPLPLKKRQKVVRIFNADGDVKQVLWHDWDFVTKSFIFSSKDYYYYPSASSANPETPTMPIRIYPNPAAALLNFSGLPHPAEVSIYSIQGVLLRSFQQVVTSVDIAGLTPGIYLILVTRDNNQPFRSMFIKE